MSTEAPIEAPDVPLSSEAQGQADPFTESVEDIIADFFPDDDAGDAVDAAPSEVEPPRNPAPESKAPEPEPEHKLPDSIAERLAAAAEADARKYEREKQHKQEVEEARKEAAAAVVQELLQDPVAFLTKHDIKNAGDLAMYFYAHELGDDAPPELLEKVGKSKSSAETRALKAELEAIKQQLQQQQQVAAAQQVLDGYKSFLVSVPEEVPYFAREVQADPQAAIQAMAQIGDRYAATYGEFPTPSQVAQIINAELERTIAKHLPSIKSESPAQVSESQKPKPKQTQTTLSDELTERGTGRPASDEFMSEEDRVQSVIAELDELFPPRKQRR